MTPRPVMKLLNGSVLVAVAVTTTLLSLPFEKSAIETVGSLAKLEVMARFAR